MKKFIFEFCMDDYKAKKEIYERLHRNFEKHKGSIPEVSKALNNIENKLTFPRG